jgi:hypothetical protein
VHTTDTRDHDGHDHAVATKARNRAAESIGNTTDPPATAADASLAGGRWSAARKRSVVAPAPQSLRDENQRLRAENHSLKTELALAYGQQRER